MKQFRTKYYRQHCSQATDANANHYGDEIFAKLMDLAIQRHRQHNRHRVHKESDDIAADVIGFQTDSRASEETDNQYIGDENRIQEGEFPLSADGDSYLKSDER